MRPAAGPGLPGASRSSSAQDYDDRPRLPGSSEGRACRSEAACRLEAACRSEAACRKSQVCTPGAALLPGRASWLSPNSQDAKATGIMLSEGSPPAGEGLGPWAGNCQEAAPWTCCAPGIAAGGSGVLPSSGTGRARPLVRRDPPWPWLPVTLSSPAPLGEPCVGACGDRESEVVFFRSRVCWGAVRLHCSRERVRACDLGSAPSPSVSAL